MLLLSTNNLKKFRCQLLQLINLWQRPILHPDFIKIDTEGYEINVLKGALNTIKEIRPLIIFETNKFPERKILWDFFTEVNYVIQELPYHPEHQLKKFSFELFSKKGSTNYIAVPGPEH